VGIKSCWDCRTRACHIHSHRIEAVEVLRHASWEVTILGIWRSLFKRPELVFALILLFFTAIAAIGAIRPITAIVSATMPTGQVSKCYDNVDG
jgi:hypothetical protein